jgi:GntR family transcriptional regulator
MQYLDAADATRHPRAAGGSAGNRQRSARVVHQLLRSSIKSGVLKVGDLLSEDDLIQHLESTRTSVRAALQMLADEGLVSRRRRTGTVVQAKAIQIQMHDIVTTGRSSAIEYRQINDQQIPATGLIKERLRTDQDRVRMVEYLLKVGEVAIGTLVAFQDPNAKSLLHYRDIAEIADTFRSVYGVPFGRMDCWIDAVAADKRTACMLGVPVGGILLVRDQVLSDSNGHIHEFAYAHYRADKVSFRS